MNIFASIAAWLNRGAASAGPEPVIVIPPATEPQMLAATPPVNLDKLPRDRFAACLPFTLGEEGGLSMDPSDPGNWTGGRVGQGVLKGTNFGISAAEYPTMDIANLTESQAADIYRNYYWTAARCANLPAGVDQCVFDFAVNAGVRRSLLTLQDAANVTADGSLGPVTLAAINAMEPAALIGILMAAREHFYATMADAARYATALDGRAERCRAVAMRMLVPKPA